MFEPRTKEEWLFEVEKRSKELETPRDRLVLFSGSEPDPRALLGKVYSSLQARAVAGPNSMGFVTVTATSLGRDLEAAQLYHELTSKLTRSEAREVWVAASREICRQASGNVTVLLRPNASPRSIFLGDELPILLDNERVTSINGVSREQLRDRSPEHVRSILVQNAPRVQFSAEALQQRIMEQREKTQAARVPPPPPPQPPRPKYGP